MKKFEFTLSIEVLETLEKKDSEDDYVDDYVKALYELLEAMKRGEVCATLDKMNSGEEFSKALYESIFERKHGEDLENLYFDTALEVLDYIEELNADLGYFSDISKLGTDLFE